MRKLVLLLSAAMFLHFSCEDSRVEDKLEESIEMWVNGSEFNVRSSIMKVLQHTDLLLYKKTDL